MAPKRSSRTKRKRVERDSYDQILFRCNEVALRFPNFETRTIHKGKHIDLEELGNLEPIRWFTNLDTLSLLQINDLIYPRLVMLFYANLSVDNDNLTTYLLGIQIQIFDSTICELIGITEKDKSF